MMGNKVLMLARNKDKNKNTTQNGITSAKWNIYDDVFGLLLET